MCLLPETPVNHMQLKNTCNMAPDWDIWSQSVDLRIGISLNGVR